MKNKHIWGWPIAGYLFLGGLGGGMVVVTAIADLFLGSPAVMLWGALAGAILIAFGSGLLIFELGRPFQFWRVFSRERAILTVGAWLLSLCIVIGIVYASFLLWHGLEGLRMAVAWVCLFIGMGVIIYTGIFLGTMKARPFWNGPALPVLFLISSLSTGIAAQSLLARFLDVGSSSTLANSESFLSVADIILLVLEIIVVLLYVLIMWTSTTQSASHAAATWLKGSKKLAFWGGLVGMGLIVPLVLYLLGNSVASLVASICVLIGGLILRFLVVYTDDRTLLPGEAEFLAKLPNDDEEFLHAWEEPDHEAE